MEIKRIEPISQILPELPRKLSDEGKIKKRPIKSDGSSESAANMPVDVLDISNEARD